MLLVDFDDEKKKKANVIWNSYENWTNGVDSYDQLAYSFESDDMGFEHCFKIKANESAGNDAYSWSNISCITFIPQLYPYNIITPNGDGKNDTFHIDNIEHYPNALLKIFNRWGKKIFETREYQNNWGGVYNDQILPNSTYYYSLELNESRVSEKTINGMVSILK